MVIVVKVVIVVVLECPFFLILISSLGTRRSFFDQGPFSKKCLVALNGAHQEPSVLVPRSTYHRVANE